MTPSAKRQAIETLVREHNLSIRRACRVVGFSRSAWNRTLEPRARRDAAVIAALGDLVSRHHRWGFWKCYDRFRMEGRGWNHKRVHRVYCALRLNLPRRARRRIPQRLRQPLVAPKALNEIWALDFMHDRLYDGRPFRTLNVIDESNREALGIEVAASIPAVRVVDVLGQLEAIYGRPKVLRLDNGPELTSSTLVEWCEARSIELRYIEPGKPDQNAYIERFNRTYREEVLNAYLFEATDEVQTISDQWLTEYNEERPHEALGGVPPRMFQPRETAGAQSMNAWSS